MAVYTVRNTLPLKHRFAGGQQFQGTLPVHRTASLGATRITPRRPAQTRYRTITTRSNRAGPPRPAACSR